MFQCLKCYELFLFLFTEQSSLGKQLLDVCADDRWQDAIILVGKGEWSRSDLREWDENVCKSCVLV